MSQAIIKTLTNAEGNETIYPRTTKEAVYGLGNIIYAHGDEVETEVSSEYLKSTPQELSDTQKAQARLNIDAASTGEFNTLSNNVAYKTHLCNPNLLDNWYFGNPVNQRGQMSYSGEWSYSIDRWRMGNRATSLNVTSAGLEMNDVDLIQYIEKPEILLGKTITASALDTNGNLLSITATIPNTLPGVWTRWGSNGNENWYIAIDGSNDITVLLGAMTGADTTTFVATKLELGSEQTLAHQENGVWVLNEIPSYADELAKCAQYNLTIGEHVGPYTMTKLWENASPTSAFGAQTIFLSLSGYSLIVMLFNHAVDATRIVDPRIFRTDQQVWAHSFTGGKEIERTIDPSSSGIAIGSCTGGDGYVIPVSIYGIKGVL